MLDASNFVLTPVAFSFSIGDFQWSIYWYGIIIACALVAGILLALRNMRIRGGNPDDLVDLTLLVVPLAIIGARLYYVAFMWDMYFTGEAWYKVLYNVIAVWHGGLAIYGGVIGGLVGLVIFARHRKLNVLWLCDIIAPSLILGQAIGRWGNFANQEAYGFIVNNPALQFFPFSVYIENLQQYHMATFFYESLWNFIVFAILLTYFNRRKSARNGNVFFLYLILYGLGRAFIEGLRTDSLYILDTSLRVSQLLSAALVVFGLTMMIIRNRKAACTPAQEEDAAEEDNSVPSDEESLPDDDSEPVCTLEQEEEASEDEDSALSDEEPWDDGDGDDAACILEQESDAAGEQPVQADAQEEPDAPAEENQRTPTEDAP